MTSDCTTSGTRRGRRTRHIGIAFLAAVSCTSLPALAEEPSLPVANPDVRLCIQPLGKHDASMLEAIVRGVRYVYGFDVQTLPAQKMPEAAWYPPRKRYRADEILDWLREQRLPNTSCRFIVGFTSHDISTTKAPQEDWGVLGLGELGGVVAVVSSFRTHKRLTKPHTALRRTVKVVNHEIGHVMGLPHNTGAGCLMNDAEGTVDTVDEESGLLCESTIEYIEKHRGYRVPRHRTFEWDKIE